MLTAGAIKVQARSIGFDLCGIAPAVPFPELGLLRPWLDRGCAGTMDYLARTVERRTDPRLVLPGARSIIVLGTVYNVDRPGSTGITDPTRALISRYAWGDDYHTVLAARVAALVAWMREQSADPIDARAYVDTGPVQEKVLAHYAGIGWLGKNACVINGRLGSWIFLSVILSTLDLEPDAPAVDQCGMCELCLEACPTGALIEPRMLDASRCLSYLTIELKGPIPAALRPALGNHVFGCDICQDICPWNAGAARSHAPEWQPRVGLDTPRLADLWQHSDAHLAALVRGTPLTRPKLIGLRRNMAVAIGNGGDPAAHASLSGQETADGSGRAPSRYDPVVREHVAWAEEALRARGLT
ncbi:MAG: tRNA epoxyqueuosine(34) reductase QueG [Acidobacteria bacterium]|nr:tRNA epoxyqueuosine(34) reductase QueG [Acidobacteriota bacterium]